ncbi:hypothetical protein BGZ82_000478 [Podila clonocystis]|nr:hypothetical protein BGZ82_000478 [Podila clonocystis]
MTHTQLPPELLLVVAEYLTPAEATAPSLVCRVWQEIFGSIIWRTYMIKPRDMAPAISTLTKNAHHTRKLEYFATVMDVENDLAVPYTHLTSLWFYVAIRQSGRAWIQLVPLIMRNQQLHELVLGDPGRSVPADIWAALAALPMLRTLELRDFGMGRKHWETIWNGCKGLRELRLLGSYNMGESIFHEEALEIHTELQSIALDGGEFSIILRRCPNLRRVSCASDRTTVLDELPSLLLEGKLCQLDSIILAKAEDQSLALTLMAMQQVKVLVVRKGEVEDLSCHALTRHFATLQILCIPECIKNAGTFIPAVLASCPLLTNITTSAVSATDIVNGRPWICLRLKVFKINIKITDEQDDNIGTQSREIFGRISRLVHLTDLHIRAPITEDPLTFQGLDLRLESGLSQLSTLQHLQELDFGGTIQHMSVEDIAWVRMHWTQLTHAVGRCNEHVALKQYRCQVVL